MQFETRVVNGKPAIYFKEEPSRTAQAKKVIKINLFAA